MSYAIQYGPGVERDISRLPRIMLKRIDQAIARLAELPRPSGCKKLAGSSNLYRIRVGDHRIVYEIDDNKHLVIIAIVGHRSDVYRGL